MYGDKGTSPLIIYEIAIAIALFLFLLDSGFSKQVQTSS